MTLLSIERRVYGVTANTKLKAFVASLIVHVAIIAALALNFSETYTVAKPSTPLEVSLLPLASPPENLSEPQEAPKPLEKHEPQPTLPKVEQPSIPLPTITAPLPPPSAKPVDPAPPQQETAMPKAAPAPVPPAQQASGKGPDTWEGRVLARLQKYQRYPRGVRQQGVAYIRFRMNRGGHVLSSSLVRSSGFPALDQAALDTSRRADPLPKIPADRPDEIELTVPVEFYIR